MRNILLLCLLFTTVSLQGQVYNYTPIHHLDVETNPGILAKNSESLNAMITQQGITLNGNFSYTQGVINKFSPRLLMGLGGVVAHTQYNDSSSYTHAGLGWGYRNILFNKIYVKLGALYKAVYTNAPAGQFSYYHLDAAEGSSSKSFTHSYNAALSFSSPSDHYYLSFGMLNGTFGNTNDQPHLFPTYYAVHAGDFARFISDANQYSSISGSFLFQKLPGGAEIEQLSYLNTHLGILLSRTSVLTIGGRSGMNLTRKAYHFTPVMRYYKTGRWLGIPTFRSFMLGAGIDLGFDASFKKLFTPQIQLQCKINL